MSDMSDIAIKTEKLSYIYSEGLPGAKVAVRDVYLEIEKGEFLGIIGPTGSGKSTLIQHFNGLFKPSSGRVFVDGEDIWENKEKLRRFRFKVGLVFQYPEYQLFEETVRKDISFGPKNMGMSEDETDERVRRALRFVGMDESELDVSPFGLSGGQKRRVAIAGVLAMTPEVLILDEPAAGLDPAGRKEILGQIKQYHKQQQNTVIIVSHSMEDIARYASKVLVMNGGEIFAYGSVGEIFKMSKELEDIGLSVPAATRVMLQLRQRGFEVDSSVFTSEQAAAALLEFFERGKGIC